MPTFYCPACERTLKVARRPEGKKPKCPTCRKVLQPAGRGKPRAERPDEEDDDRDSQPAKKGNRKGAKKGPSLGLLIGLVAGGVVIVVGTVGLCIISVAAQPRRQQDNRWRRRAARGRRLAI